MVKTKAVIAGKKTVGKKTAVIAVKTKETAVKTKEIAVKTKSATATKPTAAVQITAMKTTAAIINY